MNGRIFLMGAVGALALSISACSSDAGDDTTLNDSAAAAAPVEATVDSGTTDAGDTTALETKVYEAKGKVTKIDRERGRVELDHEKIEGWMDAMVMPFPVADPALLDQVEIGKTYTFSVEVRGDDYSIKKFTPVP